jgi:ferredoxin
VGNRISVASPKSEVHYLNRIKRFPNLVVMAEEDSDEEGFSYFESDAFAKRYSPNGSMIKDKFLSMSFKNMIRMIRIFSKYIKPIMSGRDKGFKDIEDYVLELEKTGHLSNHKNSLLKTCPNNELWKELSEYAWDKWKINIGFTEVPSQLIFKGKAILFKYAIVCIQEMDKEKIDLAPDIAAGEEVQRIYSSLGIAVNDIAQWLRQKYNVRCQANHPLGGLVSTSPLAAKAGMGWQGHNGLLITPQYGQRHRIAPIFIEDLLFEFTDNNDHVWIEKFCKTCRKCERACPMQAIYTEKQPRIKDVPGIGQTRTCIDRIKCYPQFNKTLGCSICVKVCPFSKGNDSYSKLKHITNKKV